jgi:hypothetical protein
MSEAGLNIVSVLLNFWRYTIVDLNRDVKSRKTKTCTNLTGLYAISQGDFLK